MKHPIALTIAGSDSSGGAGIQADLKTFAALGVYGASVITALTAQNTRAVTGIHAPPPEFVARQIDAVFADLDVDAVKIGMLGETAVVLAVAERLRAHARAPQIAGPILPPVVLDPVMVAKSGARLLRDDAVAALVRALVPLATVITPNVPEAAVLIHESAEFVAAQPEETCKRLHSAGAAAVVLKGGHMGGASSDDLFFDGASFIRLAAPRVETRNTHGTGCTFSSAIAAGLALGEPLASAVRAAKDYTSRAIASGARFTIGRGSGPIDHLHAMRE